MAEICWLKLIDSEVIRVIIDLLNGGDKTVHMGTAQTEVLPDIHWRCFFLGGGDTVAPAPIRAGTCR